MELCYKIGLYMNIVIIKKKIISILIILFVILSLKITFCEELNFKKLRIKLVNKYIIGQGIKNPDVIRSMLTVPREQFVPDKYKNQSYNDKPLPIGYGQTISQPYIVALMTDLLDPKKSDNVLEIGTGSGYQAAILAQIVKNVYTVEIIKPLAIKAQERFKKLGYNNIHLKVGDGYFGWNKYAPYDSIIVTAAAEHIPPPLLEQLKKGGKMCIPVGIPYFTQVLKLVEKHQDDSIVVKDIIPVLFVPLLRNRLDYE